MAAILSMGDELISISANRGQDSIDVTYAYE